MNDCEQTITIDMGKLPEKYRTGHPNPFERLNEGQISDVTAWVNGMIPGGQYCAEIIGRCPSTVGMAIGAELYMTGCVKLTAVNPGRGMTVVWDYTKEAN